MTDFMWDSNLSETLTDEEMALWLKLKYSDTCNWCCYELSARTIKIFDREMDLHILKNHLKSEILDLILGYGIYWRGENETGDKLPKFKWGRNSGSYQYYARCFIDNTQIGANTQEEVVSQLKKKYAKSTKDELIRVYNIANSRYLPSHLVVVE